MASFNCVLNSNFEVIELIFHIVLILQTSCLKIKEKENEADRER